MRTPKPPALQVLFEPFPDGEHPWNREGSEAFAGRYYFDALDAEGNLKPRGYRAVLDGCTVCRRHDDDPRKHWDVSNDLPNYMGTRKTRHCARWKLVETIVKAFGGWKRVHYVELAEYEGLQYQPIPQRRREVVACGVCGGTGYGEYIDGTKGFADCPAGCGSYTYRGRGEVQITYEGPVRPDRHAMTATQLRMR
jgi:hypothetical protein